jgi:hypothetical protein
LAKQQIKTSEEKTRQEAQRKHPLADKKEDVAKEYWGSFSKEKARELPGMGVHIHTVIARF